MAHNLTLSADEYISAHNSEFDEAELETKVCGSDDSLAKIIENFQKQDTQKNQVIKRLERKFLAGSRWALRKISQVKENIYTLTPEEANNLYDSANAVQDKLDIAYNNYVYHTGALENAEFDRAFTFCDYLINRVNKIRNQD